MTEQQHVLSCALPSWYPHLRSSTIRSVVIPLPHSFIHYLQQDGILLPTPPTTLTLNANDPRQESLNNEWSSSEEEGDEDDLKAPPFRRPPVSSSDDDEGEDDSTATTPTLPCFPELEKNIQAAIDKLGGHVFPKLDWSSPRDASFLKGGSLKCDNVGDIFLLLKGSDFVAHDITHAFDACDKTVPATATTKTPATTTATTTTTTTTTTTIPDPPTRQHHLVLRRWCNLYPSQEFRCVVVQQRFKGMSQRHCDRCFKNMNATAMADMGALVQTFYDTALVPALSSSSLAGQMGGDYFFDVYIDRHRTVTLLDFGVFSPLSTDAKLFTWGELQAWSGNGAEESAEESGRGEEGGKGEEGGMANKTEAEAKEPVASSTSFLDQATQATQATHTAALDIRYVKNLNDAVPSQLAAHRVPADMVGDPKVFMDEFVAATRRGELNTH